MFTLTAYQLWLLRESFKKVKETSRVELSRPRSRARYGASLTVFNETHAWKDGDQ